MMTRLVAWACALGIGYLAVDFVSNWQNPWTILPVGGVTSVMPALPDGCRNKAECL